MYNTGGFSLKPFAILIGFGMVAFLLVGLLTRDVFGPVSQAQANQKNAETEIYQQQQQIQLQQQQLNLDYDQRMKELQIHSEPQRIQAALNQQQKDAETRATMKIILAYSFGACLMTLSLGFVATRIINTWNKVQTAEVVSKPVTPNNPAGDIPFQSAGPTPLRLTPLNGKAYNKMPGDNNVQEKAKPRGSPPGRISTPN